MYQYGFLNHVSEVRILPGAPPEMPAEAGFSPAGPRPTGPGPPHPLPSGPGETRPEAAHRPPPRPVGGVDVALHRCGDPRVAGGTPDEVLLAALEDRTLKSILEEAQKLRPKDKRLLLRVARQISPPPEGGWPWRRRGNRARRPTCTPARRGASWGRGRRRADIEGHRQLSRAPAAARAVGHRARGRRGHGVLGHLQRLRQ
jgi:hypothetical protein